MPTDPKPRSVLPQLAIIAATIGIAGLAFLYTAGWFSPDRLSPQRYIAALAPPGGPALGHRRNHAKGICATGTFEATGAATALTTAPMFRPGTYPIDARFSLGSAQPDASDATTRVRGLGFRITAAGQEWRSANIDVPFFPVATPTAFLALLQASASKDPKALGPVAAAHPELKNFGAWAKTAPWTGSFAEERYNGLDAFLFTDAAGATHPVRWSLIPQATVQTLPPDELAKLGPDFLRPELEHRIADRPLRWTMILTVGAPGDPTNDPSHAWPDGRQTVTAGTFALDHLEPESNGPCRDINYDPTVLPTGIRISDDPFPAARSSVYAKSFDLRTAEAGDFPHTASTAQP
jgi:catalase